MTLALFPHVVADGSTDAQCTPADLAAELGTFGVDPCSNARSHVRALRQYWLERGEDGLSLPWTLSDAISAPPASVWCNPPYSDPLPWAQRLRAHGAAWAALVKLDPTTEWWRQLMLGCDAWAPFRKRLRYERPGNCGSADFPSALVWGQGFEPSAAVLNRLWEPREVMLP